VAGRAVTAWALAALALAAGAAVAQETTPGGKAVLARQAHYKELAKAFGGVGAELKKDTPDKAAIAVGAQTAKGLAQQLPTWFPKGSGPEAGVKTAAKAEVWSDADGFEAAAMKLQAETAKLADLSAAGDLDAIKTQFRATAAACNACHEEYRAPAEPK
jgi:cytochrome c556